MCVSKSKSVSNRSYKTGPEPGNDRKANENRTKCSKKFIIERIFQVLVLTKKKNKREKKKKKRFFCLHKNDSFL